MWLNKCVVFDMDGTLLDSKNSIANSINDTRKYLNLEPLNVDEICYYIDKIDENLARRFYQMDEFSDEIKKVFYSFYINECVKNLKAYEGIERLLESLHVKYSLALCSNSYDIFIDKMLKHVRLHQYFNVIVGANTTKYQKPSKFVIEYIKNALHVKNENIILIGDSQKDEICAKNANVKFIDATWSKPHANILKSINEAKNQIDEYFNQIN